MARANPEGAQGESYFWTKTSNITQRQEARRGKISQKNTDLYFQVRRDNDETTDGTQ